jgi:3-deoxy-D-manno-octulosonate 8-phosphate phosphatase (KDO 8-P phosphatase)
VSGDRRTWPPGDPEAERREAAARLGAELAARFAEIDLLVFDADGVLTDGTLVYGPAGEAYKSFHSHDGLGLVLARLAGVRRAVLTGRDSAIVARRAAELRFDAVRLGRFDKRAALDEILAETGCVAGRTLYMGDDLVDIPALDHAGVAVTVPAAPLEVRSRCAYVTTARGGAGAVREITDLVLRASGRFSLALARLAEPAPAPGRENRTPGGSGRVVPEEEA